MNGHFWSSRPKIVNSQEVRWPKILACLPAGLFLTLIIAMGPDEIAKGGLKISFLLILLIIYFQKKGRTAIVGLVDQK